MAQQHTQLVNVYFDCMRCGCTRPLSCMRWQNGQLFCYTGGCVDTAIIGSRDLNVARAVAVDRHELQPDPKITTPTSRQNDMLEVLY